MARPLPELESVQHRFVELPGLRMHVAEAGAGDPVVLLHGWPQNWWEWRHVIPGLSQRYRVICPDLRGFGWSDAPIGGYGNEQLAKDVVGLLDALQLERVRLVGHDWGGFVAFLLCLHHPERVARYLALNTVPPFPVPDARTLAALWRFWYQPVIAAPFVGPRLLDDRRQRFVRFLCRREIADQAIWSPHDTEAFLAQLREPARARASTALYRTFLARELLPGLRGRYKHLRLRTPTLLLHGTCDQALRPALLRGFESYADDMQLRLVDGAGHFIADERPNLVLDTAREFFS